MKIADLRRMRAGTILVYLLAGLAWSAYSRADDQFNPAVVATLSSNLMPMPMPAALREQQLRLPLLKAGGLSGGHVLLITESGVERMNFTALAQRALKIPSPFPDFCGAH